MSKIVEKIGTIYRGIYRLLLGLPGQPGKIRGHHWENGAEGMHELPPAKAKAQFDSKSPEPMLYWAYIINT